MLKKHLIAATAPVADEKNIIVCGKYRVTVLALELFRIEEDGTGTFCDDATQAVWFRNAEPVEYTVERTEHGMGRKKIPSDGNCMTVRTSRVSLVLREELENSEIIFADGATVPLFGGGNLKGTYRTLDCCDGDLWISWQPGKEESHPIKLLDGVVSKSGVAVYDDSASLLLNAQGMVEQRKHRETDLYVFAYGHNYRDAVRALYSLCGAPARVPRWALGNWWSRYHAYSQEEYLELMGMFEEEDIAFTVATVDMDWHPSENLPAGVDGWTGYSWNRELFPDYKEFLRHLHRMNLHVTLNLHPACGVQYIEEQYQEMAGRLGIDPETKKTVEFDFTNSDFINAYFELLHKPYERDGVDFWWIDWQQGTDSKLSGYDPLWGLNHFHFLDLAKEREGMILSRYCGVGAHRYPVGFSGDTIVTWKTLKYLPYFTATASNVGYTWWSHDIGGHMGGEKDNELYVRFLQFGVFSPINRLHSSKSDIFSKMPSAYKNGAGEIAKKFLRLRHAMLPFLYSAACGTAEKGLALIEPMYYAYPEQKEAYECGGEYLFGQQLIVAPVTEKGDASGMAVTEVWLPEGRFTDIFTGDQYAGGGWYGMVRFLDSMPVLAGEGAFFVLDGAPRGNRTELPEKLRVLAFPGKGEYSLTEDAKNGRAVTRFWSEEEKNGEWTVHFLLKDKGNILPVRSYIFELRGIARGAVSVTVNGKDKEFYLDHRDGYTRVHLSQVENGEVCELRVRETMGRDERLRIRFAEKLSFLECENGRKSELFDAFCKCTNEKERRKVVEDSGLPVRYRKFLLDGFAIE
ncbi:MAG: alpha-xylosidase [Lachnospiraceae bacterium]|nr:alpha-xylosidase [Lachnospiraceae bacterium]